MKKLLMSLSVFLAIESFSQDLLWTSTATIPDNSLNFNFGPIGSPVSSATYAVTGPGTLNSGPARFTTTQGDATWRTQITFASVGDVKTYTFTFANSVCDLTFNLYDIDGTNGGGDQAIITADNSGTPQNITVTALDATPPTISGSGTTTATVTGTQGIQTDNRVQVTVSGCVTTLVIKYGNNPAGPAGTNSFSIGTMGWTSVSPATEDLSWLTSAIPDNSTSFNFGTVGSPASDVTYNVSGPGTFDLGPLRFITTQGSDTWRTRSSFSSVSDLKSFTYTFNSAVCGLSFILYDIDGDNSSGDRALVTADYLGAPQVINLATLDANPPTISGDGTTNPVATGTQGNQDDDRVAYSIPACITTLTIQYGNNTAGAAGQRSFSIGNFSWSGNTLPVHFISFTGQKKQAGHIELNWTTENESNIASYHIERSSNGTDFNKIGDVLPLNRNGRYTFNDLQQGSGMIFYRIREVDIDGRSIYSSTVAIKLDNSKFSGITVFPNPAKDVLFVTMNDGSLTQQVRIIDSYGRVVMQKSGGQNKFDIGSLAQGLYRVIAIDNKGANISSTFIKQ